MSLFVVLWRAVFITFPGALPCLISVNKPTRVFLVYECIGLPLRAQFSEVFCVFSSPVDFDRHLVQYCVEFHFSWGRTRLKKSRKNRF